MIIDTAMQLCDIVKHSIIKKSYVLPIINEQELLAMAKENGLSGLIYNSLNNDSISDELVKKFKNEHYIYFAQSTRQDEAINDVKNIFSKNGIKHIFLKGSILRRLYPASYMRSMGDIDILVDQDNMDKIHMLFEKEKYLGKGNSIAHDKFQHTNGTDIEIHPQITQPVEGLETTLFENSWEHSFVEDGSTYRLTPEYELTYLIYHAAKHFKSSGVGLRTLLDIGLYAQAHENTIDKIVLLNMFKKAKITKFAENMLKLQNYYFSIEIFNDLYNNKDMSPEFIDFMTRYISVSGAHGTGEKFNRIIGRIAKSDVKHPKLRFFIKALFPSLKALTSQYAFVRNRVVLYPIGWLCRVFKILTTRRKNSITTLKQLTIPKPYLDQSIKMFKELGL